LTLVHNNKFESVCVFPDRAVIVCADWCGRFHFFGRLSVAALSVSTGWLSKRACFARATSGDSFRAALVTIGAIEIVAKDKAGSNSRKPAEFRYLQSEGDNGAQADHDGEVQI
jgi:hypothetical protein